MLARTRKLIGVFALLALIICYAFAAMALGLFVLGGAPAWAHFAYYVVAGLVWALPAMVLVRWMQRPD